MCSIVIPAHQVAMFAAYLAATARVKDFIASSGGFDLTCTENDRKYSSKNGAVDFFAALFNENGHEASGCKKNGLSRSCLMAGNTVD